MASAPDPNYFSPQLSAIEAHEHAVSLPIREVVRQLADLLGATTVATIGGVGETRAVAGWMGERGPQRPNVLRFALQIATMIAAGSDRELARAWFHGSNPRLDDGVPALLLRDRPLADIQGPLLAAARAFAARPSAHETAHTPPRTAACNQYRPSRIIEFSHGQQLAPSFEIERRDDGTVLSVHGEVDLASSPELETLIGETDARALLVLDLSACTYLDSSALSVFVRTYKARSERFAVVVPPGARIRRLFALTKLDEVLTVVPDRAAAFS